MYGSIRNILEETSETFEALTILELQNLAHSLKLDYEDGLREYDLRSKTGLSFPTDWTELLKDSHNPLTK